jgi:hypothetical protein
MYVETQRSIKPSRITVTKYESLIQGFVVSETDSIPMDLLARQDPVLDKIIFYDDVSLFEDELHDNGESVMNVRIVSVLLIGAQHLHVQEPRANALQSDSE